MSRQSIIINSRHMADRAAELVRNLSLEKHPWRVTVEKYVRQRSNPQNNLYWQWLTIIGNEVGYTKDDLHDVMREKFLPWEWVEVCGIRRKRLTSTSAPEFTTAMMSEYMEHIDRFAAQELGIMLPHAADAWHDHQGQRA